MENLGWGLQMTALGMGLVFALLALLWGLLSLVLRFDPAAVDAEGAADGGPDAGAGATARAADDLDADLVAAILVATLTHKAVRRQEAAPVMRSYWPGSLLFASRWVATGRARQNRSWQRKGK
jgi:glutaconyl-CoA/methylmalonyl-CoA decarboxylase subunit delta